MDIQAHEDNTGYAPRAERWHAIDHDTYDGADDSHCPVGHGATAKAAILDLLEQLLDEGDITHDEQRELFRLHHIA
jgi:hypothetical protein